MSVALPLVWDGSAYKRRLHPISCSISLNLQPLSTVNMTLPPDDEISNLEWVKVAYPDGGAGYYRVSSISTDMQTGLKSVYLEHGACVFDDIIIPDTSTRKTESLKDTITNILTTIVAKQSRWTVGTVEATDTIYIEVGGSSLMTAILTMMDSIPDYQVEFVQETDSNWHVDIKHRPTTVLCEGRLNRNLRTCNVSYSTAAICTRVYSDGLTGGKMDSQNIGLYGVREQTMSLNESLTQAQRDSIARSYLAAHDHPEISIDISAVELSQITGLTLDKFEVGKICRIVIPWLTVTATEVIISKGYSDPYTAPEDVRIQLANATPELSLQIASMTGGGGGGGAGGTKGELKRFRTKFEQTDEYFRLIAEDWQWDALGNGTLNVYSQIVQTASSLQSVVARTGYTAEAFFSESTQYREGDIVMYDGKMYEFTANHHGAWTGTDVRQITNMYTTITQSETQIETLTAKTGINDLGQSETLYSKITQNESAITLKVSKGDVSTQLAVECGNVSITGGNLVVSGYVTASTFNGLQGDFNDLTSGNALVASLRANNMQASSSFRLGTQYHHNSTITIEGVNYNIVTWDGSR